MTHFIYVLTSEECQSIEESLLHSLILIYVSLTFRMCSGAPTGVYHLIGPSEANCPDAAI